MDALLGVVGIAVIVMALLPSWCASEEAKESAGQERRRRLADSFPASSNPFASINLPTGTIPQFVVLSITGGVTPLAYDLFRPLASVKDKGGCPVVATWYISIAANNEADPYTLCNLVRGLRKSGHEMATNTYGPTSNPTVDEIERAPRYLSDVCQVPMDEMRGFRTPNLAFTQDTFDRLHSLGFLYDSSIADHEPASNGGRSALWPYTMDNGIAQDCLTSSGSCNQTHPNPGLWEIPLYRMVDPDTGSLLMPIDFQANPYETLRLNFNRRYNEGNRAPLGINIHASWLAERGSGLRQWAEEVLANHNDVFFVTTSELIQWMRNPIPAFQMRRDCSSYVTDCFPPPLDEGGCNNGDYNTSSCSCVCNYPFLGHNCIDSLDEWTLKPTTRPTPAPTAKPTFAPTSSPTISFLPTTAMPTSYPTISVRPTQPTDMPTVEPTLPPVNVRGFSSSSSFGSGSSKFTSGATASLAVSLLVMLVSAISAVTLLLLLLP